MTRASGEARLRQEDAELLAAVARRHVGRAQRGLQTLRGHLQREVARLMAVRVVVVLEVVDVHHHKAHREAVALRALKLLLQALFEVAAVEQAGQRVCD